MVCVLAAIERGFRNYREIEVIKMVNVTVKLTVIPKLTQKQRQSFRGNSDFFILQLLVGT